MPIEKRSGETRDEFVSRCVKQEMDSGKPQDQALAICLTYADENFTSDFADSYTDYPKAATENAKTALRWAEENGWGDCGTPVGKARANQLANGEAISRETISRMAAFERHRQNSDKELGDRCGRLMWLAWGGDEGIEWAQRKLEQIDKLSATSSVSDATWSTEAPISINFERISIDFDDTLTTQRGMDMAKRLIAQGHIVFIISARVNREGMLKRAEELGIPVSRVFATGSNKKKEEKIKELKIERHIDNNEDVVKALPGVAEKFGKVRKVLFEEDFNPEEAKMYKEMGFKVYIRSSRKIKKKDKKVWNQLKQASLSEDNLAFGSIEELDKKHNFDLLLTGDDPMLEALLVRGQKINPKKVLMSIPIESIEDAITKQDEALKSIDLKFANIKFLYKYEEIPGIPPVQTTSRPFCKRMMTSDKWYSLEEIKSLSNVHLKEMFKKYAGLQPDVFLYRGGFYRLPGTLNTTPYCRHQWTLKIVMD